MQGKLQRSWPKRDDRPGCRKNRKNRNGWRRKSRTGMGVLRVLPRSRIKKAVVERAIHLPFSSFGIDKTSDRSVWQVFRRLHLLIDVINRDGTWPFSDDLETHS